jgi:hypothetical protein
MLAKEFQKRTFNLSPYSQSQQSIRYTANSQGISLATLAVGTTSDTVSIQPEDALFYIFAAAFISELQQPTIAALLSDVPNAAKTRFGITTIGISWTRRSQMLSIAGPVAAYFRWTEISGLCLIG